MEHRAADAPATPLSPSERARGRRFAIASHPAGNTFAQVFTNHLPTLALVALGAGEALIGFHQAALLGCRVLQLPTLRAVARFRKRHILVAGQVFALVFALPLLFFGILAGIGLDLWLGAAASRLDVYHVFFSICGLLVAAAFLPLRAFRR